MRHDGRCWTRRRTIIKSGTDRRHGEVRLLRTYTGFQLKFGYLFGSFSDICVPDPVHYFFRKFVLFPCVSASFIIFLFIISNVSSGDSDILTVPLTGVEQTLKIANTNAASSAKRVGIGRSWCPKLVRGGVQVALCGIARRSTDSGNVFGRLELDYCWLLERSHWYWFWSVGTTAEVFAKVALW